MLARLRASATLARRASTPVRLWIHTAVKVDAAPVERSWIGSWCQNVQDWRSFAATCAAPAAVTEIDNLSDEAEEVTALEPKSEKLYLTCGNSVQALHNGEECFPAIYEAIENAKDEIMFEMYWFESDRAGWAVARRLMDAARRGVKVTVVYDSFGSIDADPAMFHQLRLSGCTVHEFNPIRPWRQRWFSFSDLLAELRHALPTTWSRIVRRDHRKMIVIDRKIAFTGGMNVGDFWLPKSQGGEGWRDVMVKVEGPVVPAFAGIFDRLVSALEIGHDDRGPQDKSDTTLSVPTLGDRLTRGFKKWEGFQDKLALSVDKGKDVWNAALLKRLNSLPETTLLLFPFQVIDNVNDPSSAWWSAQGRIKLKVLKPRQQTKRELMFEQVKSKWQKLGSNIQIITNDAFSERNSIRRGYIRAINTAKSSITIVNSYFVPCSSIRRALYRAADRGVDVRIIVPGNKTDLHSVRWATHAYYESMLRRGIKLYEYMPSVLHSKLCIIDSKVATLGTYNLDYRSWYHNLEIVAVIHDERFAQSLEDRMDQDIEESCELVTLQMWRERPFFKRLFENFFYFFRHHM